MGHDHRTYINGNWANGLILDLGPLDTAIRVGVGVLIPGGAAGRAGGLAARVGLGGTGATLSLAGQGAARVAQISSASLGGLMVASSVAGGPNANNGGGGGNNNPGGAAPTGEVTVDPAGTFSASERNAAQHMADLGHKVALRAPVGTRAGGATSDLLVDGVRYDVYTPTTNNAGRIISAIAKKNSQVQGGGVVLDLSRTTVTRAQLGDVLKRVQGAGARGINDIVIIGGN